MFVPKNLVQAKEQQHFVARSPSHVPSLEVSRGLAHHSFRGLVIAMPTPVAPRRTGYSTPQELFQARSDVFEKMRGLHDSDFHGGLPFGHGSRPNRYRDKVACHYGGGFFITEIIRSSCAPFF